MKQVIGILILWISFSIHSFSQEDLLDLLGPTETKEYVSNAFKSPRVIGSHSMEMLAKGALDFRILHRFGRISSVENFFGLDNATMRMSFDYGITKNLTLGLARSTFKKEVDGFVKYRIVQQSKGKNSFPISIVWVSGMIYNTLQNPYSEITTEDKPYKRMSYFHQIIIGRKFSENFSLQLSPLVVHSNLVSNILYPNTIYALNVSARYKLTKRLALVIDYSPTLNKYLNRLGTMPLGIGVDIETGGHVFQLHFSNAMGMNERAYIAEENGDWLKGQFQFGFNLSRVFQVGSRKKW